MADHAVGKTCPNDGTLTACSGSYTDETLVGQCAFCQQPVTTPNPHYRAFVAPAGYKLVPIDDTSPSDEVDTDPSAPVIVDSGDLDTPPVIEMPSETPETVTTWDMPTAVDPAVE